MSRAKGGGAGTGRSRAQVRTGPELGAKEVVEHGRTDNGVGALEAWLDGWDPPQAMVEDPMDPAPVRALAAALNQPVPSASEVPALWHWLYFLNWERSDALGPDGHPRLGGFLPPIPRRTRMFAGARVKIARPLRLGEAASLRSSLSAQRETVGRSGPMLLVTERHEIVQHEEVAVVEERDLVYRSRQSQSSSSAGSASLLPPAMWVEAFVADPVLLFRFSALTANSHRIHYDKPYVTGVEGYPGLVVHGPLLAIAMAEMLRRHVSNMCVTNFHVRFRRPVFVDEQVFLMARRDGGSVWITAAGNDGVTRAEAEVALA